MGNHSHDRPTFTMYSTDRLALLATHCGGTRYFCGIWWGQPVVCAGCDSLFDADGVLQPLAETFGAHRCVYDCGRVCFAHPGRNGGGSGLDIGMALSRDLLPLALPGSGKA